MGYGGYHPYPRRFGGNGPARKPLLQVVHESLNAQRGTAFDPSGPTKIVWVENMAIARSVVFDGWGMNQRLANQWDPWRMTDMLARWERILAIVPDPSKSEQERRAEVAERMARFGAVPNNSRLLSELQALLGPVFVALEYISITNAVIHVPDGTYPWGTPAAGVPWYSTVAHILIRTQKPAGYSEAEFYAAVATINPLMDALAPAWVTWDWYRPGPISNFVVGGPSAGGFYLDDDHNLDNEVFDV